MKRCPSCQATYPDTQSYCLIDGTPLVDEAPPSDPAKTLAAQPPSAPPSSGGDVPPTQVFNPTGHQPPPPLPQPPPYAPQPPAQTPYAPQGYGAPRSSRKMLYIGIVAVVLLAGGGILLWFLLSGGKTLGTYKGSLSDLLPEKVGSYSRINTGTFGELTDKRADDDGKRFFGYDEARAAKYENNGKRMMLVAANFSSPDSAKAAFNKAKDGLLSERARWTLKDSGKSKKDGERAVFTQPAHKEGEEDIPEIMIVLWTNGSVVFGVIPAAMFTPMSDREKELGSLPSSSETIDFEKNMPY